MLSKLPESQTMSRRMLSKLPEIQTMSRSVNVKKLLTIATVQIMGKVVKYLKMIIQLPETKKCQCQEATN